MFKVWCFIILLVFSNNCFSQISFDGKKKITEYRFESSFKHSFYRQVDSLFNLDKTYDFELRLWINQDVKQDCKLFILSNSQGRFKARCFKYMPGSLQSIQEMIIQNGDLDTLWSNLVKNKLLELRFQKDVEYKMIRYTTNVDNFEKQPIHNIGLSDEDSYFFEIFTKKEFKSFEYKCPKYYLETYPQTEEFYRVYVITSLIKRIAGIRETGC